MANQAKTELTQLETMKANLEHFSFKKAWQTISGAMVHITVADIKGETAGMSTALTTNSPSTSISAWQVSNVAVSPAAASTYISGETVGASGPLSELAFIEASDSISPTCLTAVGQYNALATSSAVPTQSLQTVQLDGSAGSNSEVQQLNLLNASFAQSFNELHAQGVMGACQAAQATLTNMQQRNAASQTMNDAAYKESQQAINPTYAGNESGTWTTYY